MPNFNPFRKKNNKPAGSDAPSEDLKNIQETLIASMTMLNFYRRARKYFSAREALLPSMKGIMGIIQDSFPFAAGSILLVDEAANDLFFAAAFGDKAEEVMKFRVPLGKGIVGHSVVDKNVIAVSDVSRDKRFDKTISEALGFKTTSILSLPVISGIKCLGALELINKTGSDIFTNSELNSLREVSDILAMIIINKKNG